MSLSRYKKKIDSHQERDVVVAGHHVFRAQVNESRDCSTLVRFDKRRVAFRDVVRHRGARKQQHRQDEENRRGRGRAPG